MKQKIFSRLLALVGCLALALPASAEAEMLVPLGRTAGIRIYAEGVIIAEVSDVMSGGSALTPARDAGLKKGDVILAADGRGFSEAGELSEYISSGGGAAIEFVVRRADEEKNLTATPAKADADGKYRLGMLIRDSIAGIGTLTFYDPDTGLCAALGHGVTDADSGLLVPFGTGELIKSSVAEVQKGEKGAPGMLHGEFDRSVVLGTLFDNTPIGIFGWMDAGAYGEMGEPIPLATASQVHTGEAVILANVSGEEICEYSVRIDSVGGEGERNMLLTVTDDELISLTGGIVQGMSGSPIIQDGLLAGAVTHVLIGEPTMGYGIFAESMLAEASAERTAA